MLLVETTLMGAAGAAAGENYLFTWGVGQSGALGQYTSTGLPPNNYTQLSWLNIDTGSQTVAIRSDSTLWTWGLNDNGQLGDGTTFTRGSPVQLGTSSWVAVATGRSATYAIRQDGRLFTWGLNSSGQLGDGTTINRSSPHQIGTSSWTTVSSMGDYAVAIRQGGTLFAWGNNFNGQLGNGDSTGTFRSSPVQIGTSSWTAVGAGAFAVSAIRQGGTLFVWGDSTGGTVPAGTTSGTYSIGTASWTAVAVANGSNAIGIKDGKLWVWGRNDNSGSLGLGTTGTSTENYSSPIQIGTSSWIAVSTAYTAFFAIRQDGRLFSWGSNTYGQLGDGTLASRSSPTQIGTSSWVALAYKHGGEYSMYAIRQGGTLFAWGYNGFGQLGDETRIDRSSPVQIGTSSWNMVTAGNYHALAIRQGGGLFAWGNPDYGALGIDFTQVPQSWTAVSVWGDQYAAAIRTDGRLFAMGGAWAAGTYVNSLTPVGTSSWTAVSINQSHILAVRQGGTLFAWGYQTAGIIGNGTSDSNSYYSSPVQIGNSSWSAVSAGRSMSAAIRSDGKLFVWGGYDPNNQASTPLGLDDFIARSSPTQLGTSNWTSVQLTSGGFAMAIRQGGSLFTWGRNNQGQLGLYDSAGSQIYGIDSWSAVGVGESSTMAIRNQRLYGWGEGGLLGQNSYALVLSPVVIGDRTWSSISVAPSAAAGITTNGQLYVWGSLVDGQAGDSVNSYLFALSPIQVGTSSWTQVSVSNQPNSGHIMAIRQGGTLFTWGLNNAGQLGDGTLISRSSPVQIGTSSWTQIRAGASHSMAVRQDGRLYTWGWNQNGQLGNYSNGEPSVFESWISVSAGYDHTLAIKPDGKVWAWGNNSQGQLGTGDYNATSSPTAVLLATSVTAVSASYQFSYALGLDKRLYFWGVNSEGQAGNNTQSHFSYSPTPIQAFTFVNPTNSWTAVTAAQGSVWAIRQDGTMWAAGANAPQQSYPNYYGQILGDGTRIDRSSPVQIGAGVSWSQVSSVQSHAMALSTTGRLYTWGDNSYGQLGIIDSSNAVIDSVQNSWLAVVGGAYHSNGIDAQGRLYGWGWNYQHAAGLPQNFINYSFPTLITSFVGSTPGSFTQVAAGIQQGMAIDQNKAHFVWGDDTSFQVGYNGSIVSTPSQQYNDVVEIAMGDNHSIVRFGSNGVIYLTGVNTWGAIGNNSNFSPSYGWTYIGGDSWSTIGAGQSHSMAVRHTGQLYTWGYNNSGQLGTNDLQNRSSPTPVGSSSWTQVAGGAGISIAIRRGGSLFTWGDNFNGSLGDGTRVNKSSPVLIGSSSWTAISKGGQRSTLYAIRQDGRLFSWGLSQNGELGLNSNVSRSSPTQIGTSSWSFVGTGWYNAGGVNSSTRVLYMWGNNQYYALGTGNATSQSSPVTVGIEVPALTPLAIGNSSWTAISAGWYFSTAIRQGGTLFTWGRNAYGVLGFGDLVYRSSPTQLGTSSWTSVSAGWENTWAVRQGGMGFAWGINNWGQIGDGTTLDSSFGGRSSPVAIAGGATNYNFIAGSRWNAYWAAAKGNAGAISSWGRQGQWLGYTASTPQTLPKLVGSTNVSSPVQIGTSSWVALAADRSSSAAIRQGGTLFTWGDNTDGQLGLSDNTERNSPVQVGTSSWVQVAMNNATTVATTATGSLFTWGYQQYLRLGTNSYQSRSSPVVVSGTAGSLSFTQVAMGVRNAAAIQSVKGELWVWGERYLGVTDYGSAGEPITQAQGVKNSPIQIGTSSWSSVGAGTSHSMAIRQGGTLFGWGANYYGQIGNGTSATSYSSPIQIGSNSWIAVQGYNNFTGALTSTNQLFTWGYAYYGVLGLGDTIERSSPALVGSNYYALARSDGYGSSSQVWIQNSRLMYYAGYIYGWYRAPGEPPPDSRSSPTLVYAPPNTNSPLQVGASSWSIVAAGLWSSSAVGPNGYLWAWGYNNFGQLGDSTTINRSSPVSVGFSGYRDLSMSQYYRMAVTNGGLIEAVGYNTVGVLGDGTTINRSVAVYIGSGDFRQVSLNTANYQPALVGSTGLWNTGGGYWYFVSEAVPAYRSSPTFVGWSNFSSPVQIGTSSWTAVSIGRYNGIAIRSNGSLFTWGGNQRGQIGIDSLNNNPIFSPVQVGTSSWTAVSNGRYTQTALAQNGQAYVWGLATGNAQAPLGITDRSSPTALFSGQITNSWTVVRSLRGDNQFGGVGIATNSTPASNSGLAWFWGNGGWAMGQGFFYNAVGVPVVLYNNQFGSPVQVGDGSNWSETATGDNWVLGLRSGSLYGWGFNSNGQLGQGDTIARSSPVQIATGSWSDIAVGPSWAVAIRQDGQLWSWGSGNNGQLGNGTSISRSSPTLVSTSSWSMVSAGDHTAAVRLGGTLFTWGQNNLGELGDGTRIQRSSPVQIGASSWSMVAAGSSYTMAIRQDGALFAWGANQNGVLGNGLWNVLTSPVQIGTSSWTTVSAGRSHVLAVRSDGKLFGWGRNSQGEVAQAVTTVNYSQYRVRQNYSCAIDSLGRLWTAGTNTYGLLGVNVDPNISNNAIWPLQVGTSAWSYVYPGPLTMMAIRQDGRLFSWGYNQYGMGGDGTTLYRSSPVQIGTSSWVMAFSNWSSVALRQGGTLFAWGYGFAGGIGDGSQTNRSSPVQIGTSSWVSVGQSSYGFAAIRQDGRLFTVGYNPYGQLGQGDNVYRSSPVQVGTSSWIAVAGGENHYVAIRQGGTLFAWGINSQGELGQGDLIARSSPTQIGSSSWIAVSAQLNNCYAIRQDGTMWAWGLGTSGQLGENTYVTRSSPVQVSGGLSWTFTGGSGGITNTQQAYGWGNNFALGYGSPSSTVGSPVQVNISISNTVVVSPTQIGNSSWTAVSAGWMTSAALSPSELLYTWGRGTDWLLGGPGSGTTENRSSPVQVGGAVTWQAFSLGRSQASGVSENVPL